MIRIGFVMQIAKTPTYSVMCRFPLFVAICDHNLPTLQTDGRTSCSQHKRKMQDDRHVALIKKKTRTSCNTVFSVHKSRNVANRQSWSRDISGCCKSSRGVLLSHRLVFRHARNIRPIGLLIATLGRCVPQYDITRRLYLDHSIHDPYAIDVKSKNTCRQSVDRCESRQVDVNDKAD